jgi:hypothetical protein
MSSGHHQSFVCLIVMSALLLLLNRGSVSLRSLIFSSLPSLRSPVVALGRRKGSLETCQRMWLAAVVVQQQQQHAAATNGRRGKG